MRKILILSVIISVIGFTSCKSKGWSNEYKAKFIQDCTTFSRDMTAAQVKVYCDCVADKAEKKFPDEKVVDGLSDEQVKGLKAECGGK